MAIIISERQYNHTKKSVETFKESVKERPLKGESDKDWLNRAAMIQGAYMITQLQAELKEYEDIKAGKIPPEFFEFENIGWLLIALRIKNGLTQTELAAKLEVAPSQVSRDENNEYHGASLPTIRKILEALGESLTIKLSKKSRR